MLAFASIHSNFSWSFDLHPIGANVSSIFRVNSHKVASIYKLSVVGWIGLQKREILEVNFITAKNHFLTGCCFSGYLFRLDAFNGAQCGHFLERLFVI